MHSRPTLLHSTFKLHGYTPLLNYIVSVLLCSSLKLDSCTLPPHCTLLLWCTVIITRRYSLLCGFTSSSFGGFQPLAVAFFALWAKKELFMLFVLILGHIFLQQNKRKKETKKSSLFLNIRNMRFYQSSPVKPTPEKKS